MIYEYQCSCQSVTQYLRSQSFLAFGPFESSVSYFLAMGDQTLISTNRSTVLFVNKLNRVA